MYEEIEDLHNCKTDTNLKQKLLLKINQIDFGEFSSGILDYKGNAKAFFTLDIKRVNNVIII